MSANVLAFSLLGATGLLACGSSDGTSDGGGGNSDGGSTGADAGSGTTAFPARWEVAQVESGNTGYQPSIAVAPNGTIGVAYLKNLSEVGQCQNSPNPQVITRWSIMYVSSTDGITWSAPEVIDTIDLLSLAGVSLVFDAQSKPAVAYIGGILPPTAQRCGASDMVLAQKSGSTWSKSVLDEDGTATPVFPEDVQACVTYQNYCDFAGPTGVVGLWPSLVIHDGGFAVAYRDIHQGIAQDDEEKSDLQIVRNGQKNTLDATWGGGIFASMATAPGNKLYIAHANPHQTDFGNGIWMIRFDGSAWTRKKLSSERLVGYRLTVATSGERVGLAYHASGAQKLRYVDSADGVTFGSEVTVDQSGNTGLSPWLAFSPKGDPAISYHYCGPYDPQQTNCPQDKDALRYALFEGGRWRYVDAVTTNGGVDGAYTSLAFDAAGMPVIAYQATYFDPVESRVTRELRVVRGVGP